MLCTYTHTRVYNAPLLTVDRQPTFNNRPFHVPNWSSTLVKSLSIVSKALERYLISRSRHDYRAPHEKRTNLTKLIETTCSSPHTSRSYSLSTWLYIYIYIRKQNFEFFSFLFLIYETESNDSKVLYKSSLKFYL